MSKTANFDNKVGSFGIYGGKHTRKTASGGYYIKVCSMCPKTALYHCSRKGFCKDHREFAVKLRLRFRDSKERASEAIEIANKEWDRAQLAHIRAAKTHKFGV